MPRRETDLIPGHYYHLYNRGNDRQPIFFERDNYLFFLHRVRQYLIPTVDVIAYCLMPNHYHLLALLNEPDLSHRMQLLGISYTKAVNRQQGRVGALFAGAFHAKLVDRDEYLLHLARYIHLNPVRAGLAAGPDDWEFSSHREFAGARDGSLPRPDVVWGQCGGLAGYREFVAAYMTEDRARIAHLLR